MFIKSFFRTKRLFDNQKMTSASLIVLMIGLLMLMSVLPIGITNGNPSDQTVIAVSDGGIDYELKINSQSPFLFSLPFNGEKRIAMGESKHSEELKAKEKAVKASFDNGRRLVIARSEPANRYGQDRSYQDKVALAKQAAASVNMDWKVLMAVWQIESGASWDTSRSSHMGATGPWQFMPGTWRGYAVDANGDGQASIYSAEDGAYAAAKLLAANGVAVGQVDRALFAYNHSQSYVNKVKRIADAIAE